MSDFLSDANAIVWSSPLVYLCLAAGLYFTIRLRLVQVRHIPGMLEQLRKGESSEAGVSSFQALAMSLAGRVGMGNIGGVATAIAFGGPGAVFWMWVMAFLGAATSFIECSLGQVYKERDKEGEYRGGPAYYIEKGLGMRWYGMLFAFVTVLAMGLLLPGVQANGISSSMENAWGLDPRIVAIGVVIALAFIVVGGLKRIAVFASMVVPFMAIAYILLALIILFVNITEVPAMFALIVRSAFGLDAAFGSILGMAVMWGVKRGLYSNEAGQGTGPHAAAAAEVSHPAKQGLAQAFAVYVDTLFVCTATAIMILSTGMYRVHEGGSADGAVIHSGPAEVADVEVGPAFTQAALDSVFPGLGGTFVAVALLFFAFTTIVAYYYMAEVNLTYLLRGRSHTVHVWSYRVLQLIVLVVVAYGTLTTADDAWAAGDLGVGLMAWLNIIAILILQGPAIKVLKDYEAQKKQGVDPQFDPRPLGIKNATFWEERADRLAVGPDTALEGDARR
ncbi:alanine/glycine:cation symporter family protein [Ornithinimicrobium tianjinense]|uniref:Sodium:alanine symporter n=1 Tax=Ornithinimicrobium tianjinense TaxID=1195761 RepID=A0A917BM86_9MICO|nr:alanine/glycine:cation symporter family protein [Ornithinimicrobium tianjinense]GGF49329.1 sodium:alanine symporter [Ornithinimicrobium tianjinense]